MVLLQMDTTKRLEEEKESISQSSYSSPHFYPKTNPEHISFKSEMTLSLCLLWNSGWVWARLKQLLLNFLSGRRATSVQACTPLFIRAVTCTGHLGSHLCLCSDMQARSGTFKTQAKQEQSITPHVWLQRSSLLEFPLGVPHSSMLVGDRV